MSTCPKCGSDLSAVVESRLQMSGSRRRRRECNDCGHRWSTVEEVIGEPAMPRVKRSRKRRQTAEPKPQPIDGPSCVQCRHWQAGQRECQLGFPDPHLEGLGFAADCSVYEPEEVSQSISLA
jgi:hypothetical protein